MTPPQKTCLDPEEALNKLGKAILAEQPFAGLLRFVFAHHWVIVAATVFVIALMALDYVSR